MSFQDVLDYYQDINKLSRSLIRRAAFGDIHIKYPNPENPELGFIYATSWLYCLYFETGRISRVYLQSLGGVYRLMTRDEVDKHVRTVRCLRTESQHNLGYEGSDLDTRTVAETWKRFTCGTAVPRSPEEWRACYDCLINEAIEHLRRMYAVVKQIESDGERSHEYIEEWLRRLKRDWGVEDFDRIIEDAKRRMGREVLRTVEFRNRHIDKWRKALDSFDDGFDFSFEVSRLVEKSILDMSDNLLPITGQDVMEYFNIRPGPAVAALLEEARRYYGPPYCSKEELLLYLESKYDG